MNLMRRIGTAFVIGVASTVVWSGAAIAHCDSMSGPVIPEALAALEAGDVTPVLKWIAPEHEAEIRSVFEQALAARAEGPRAREIADRFFIETLVRVHRAGEGAVHYIERIHDAIEATGAHSSAAGGGHEH